MDHFVTYFYLKMDHFVTYFYLKMDQNIKLKSGLCI